MWYINLHKTEIYSTSKLNSPNEQSTQKREGPMLKRTILILTITIFILSACQPPIEETETQEENETMLVGEPFELYLVADQQMTGPDLKNTELDDLPLVDLPLIKTEDLIDYDWELHSFNLTNEVYMKLITIFSVGLPMSGVPFVVVAYGERIYAGAFWSPISSLSYDGVVILQPFDPSDSTLYILLGYPNADVFTGVDPRNNPRLQQALDDAGLLDQGMGD